MAMKPVTDAAEAVAIKPLPGTASAHVAKAAVAANAFHHGQSFSFGNSWFAFQEFVRYAAVRRIGVRTTPNQYKTGGSTCRVSLNAGAIERAARYKAMISVGM